MELNIDLTPKDPPQWPVDPALVVLPLGGLLSAFMLFLAFV